MDYADKTEFQPNDRVLNKFRTDIGPDIWTKNSPIQAILIDRCRHDLTQTTVRLTTS